MLNKKNNKINKNILKFPKGFLWGVSTSAYQVEGGITNDWSQWEMNQKRLRNFRKNKIDYSDFICGRACDSYNRHEEDVFLVTKLNCNSYRMGIEWARLEPREGDWNEEEFEHYREVLKNLKKNKVKIVLTIWHWTNPLWISMNGGWANGKTVAYYARFVKKVVDELGDLVDFWVTLNEPTIHVYNGYVIAKFPPKKRCLWKARLVFNNLIKAHKRAYNIIHKKYEKADVGITALVNNFEPAHWWCIPEVLIAKLFHYFWNHRFLMLIKNHMDYVGFNYYFHDRIIWHPPFKKNLNKKVNDMGWEIYPKGIYNVIKYLAKFKKPLFVMENGTADREDKHRADFIKDHLKYVHKAISEGADVRGYFHWSLLDNFEWASGWKPKFGLYTVDRETFERKARPSAKVYADICKNNRIKLQK